MRSVAGLFLFIMSFLSMAWGQAASRVERQRALRERPLLFGVSVDWYPDSYPMLPEVYWETLGERLRDLGATATLVEFDWSEIETAPGEFDFTRTDGEVERATGLGLVVVGRIVGSPAWANGAGRAGRYPPRKGIASDFGLFCQRVAERDRNRVDRYEFWVEPDRDNWEDQPSAQGYNRWLWTCRESLRRGNPHARLAVGALGDAGSVFLGEVYRLHGGDAFDAVAVAGRPEGDRAESPGALDVERIDSIRRVMVEAGDKEKPIWITDYGWPVETVGIHGQAEMLGRALDWMVLRDWIEMAVLDTLTDAPGARSGLTGLCDENLNLRPAYRAFADYAGGPESPEIIQDRRVRKPSGKNLAANPGFEEREGTDIASWIGWGDEIAESEETGVRWDPIGEQYEGEGAATMVAEDQAFQGGLYQVIEVPEGTWLAATVRTMVTFTKVPPKARIGIDLEGRTDLNASSITWSPWYSTDRSDAGWVEIGLEYPVRVEVGRATVFLEWSQPVAAGRGGVGFDGVYVGAVEP